MKFCEFINKHINTQVDFDKAFGAQCVDLFRQYSKDVLNIPHTGSVDSAKDLYLNFTKLPLEIKYFQRFSTKKFPLEFGDVLVWDSTPTNKYGHVAIFINIKNDNVIVFEQQGYSKTGKDKALVAERKLDNCLGALRAKDRSNI